MTNATSDTTKLNFITDHGSTRATVRCACLADERLGAVCCGRLRTWLAASPEAVLPEPALAVLPGFTGAVFPEFGDPILPGFAGAGPGARFAFALVSDLRKARAGDDRDSGGGSGISQANAAGGTVVPADLLSLPSGLSGLSGDGDDDGVPDDSVPEGFVPDGVAPDGTVPDGFVAGGIVGAGVPDDGFVPDGFVGGGVSADGSAAGALDTMESAGGGGAVSAGRASVAAWPSAAAAAGLRSWESWPFGRAVRDRPRLSAGRAGTASTAVVCAESSIARSFTASSMGSSPAMSSSGSREVTTVVEALPEPSGLFVRLSKPSSL
jgi:hypothetical protein